jgi:hypothetical protein
VRREGGGVGGIERACDIVVDIGVELALSLIAMHSVIPLAGLPRRLDDGYYQRHIGRLVGKNHTRFVAT